MVIPARKLTTPEQDLRSLFFLVRFLRDESYTPTELPDLVERLLPQVEALTLSPLDRWDLDSLQRARHFVEEITVHYVAHFHNLKDLPVTFYKREKAMRRHLDHESSRIFKEIIHRSGRAYQPELITEEPIYFLLQKAREKSFPKTPKSKGKRPLIETLRMRFHVELSSRLDPDAKDRDDRRVLLPFEIK